MRVAGPTLNMLGSFQMLDELREDAGIEPTFHFDAAAARRTTVRSLALDGDGLDAVTSTGMPNFTKSITDFI